MSTNMSLREQVVATVRHNQSQNRSRGALLFQIEDRVMGDMHGEQRRVPAHYRLQVDDVTRMGDKVAVEFVQTSSWDDHKVTGPMILDAREIDG